MRHLKYILILLLVFPIWMKAQVQSQKFEHLLKGLLDHSVPELSVSNVDTTDASIIYLDAREKREFEVSHIKNAIWIGYDDFEIERVQSIDKNAKIVVYCSVGYRSEKVSEELIEEGFKNVSNLYGGIFEWVNSENQLFQNKTLKTNKVHAYDRNWGRWVEKGEKVYK